MTTPTSYQVGILGRPRSDDKKLITALEEQLVELGVDRSALTVIPEGEIAKRDRKRPFIGVFFGYQDATDSNHPILADLLQDSVVLIPTVPDIKSVTKFIPENCATLIAFRFLAPIRRS
jgi:hypothetical protein